MSFLLQKQCGAITELHEKIPLLTHCVFSGDADTLDIVSDAALVLHQHFLAGQKKWILQLGKCDASA